LPLAGEAAPGPSKPGGASTSAAAGPRPLRILVVDDNVDAARSLALFLRRAGHATASSHDGVKALESVSSFKPDVVLLDIGLPGMNGYDVARAIRGRTPATLIAMSGYNREEDAQVVVFDHYLVKPVNPDTLLALLSRVGP
jgi:CheY-like chemotaxis protein